MDMDMDMDIYARMESMLSSSTYYNSKQKYVIIFELKHILDKCRRACADSMD